MQRDRSFPTVELVPVAVDIVLTMTVEEATAVFNALGSSLVSDHPDVGGVFDELGAALEQIPEGVK